MIEAKKSVAACLSFVGVLIALLSVILFVYGISEQRVLYRCIGIIGTLFFGSSSIYIIPKSVRPKPLLTISFDGFIDTSNASSFGFIPFQEVDTIKTVNVFGQKAIGVTLKNVEEFTKKMSPVKQKLAKRSVSMGLPPITIRVDSAKDMSLEDIVTLLEKRLSDYQRLYS